MTPLYRLGFNAYLETFLRGENIASAMNTLWIGSTRQTEDIVRGAIGCLLTQYIALEKDGRIPQFDDEETNRFMHSSASNICAIVNQKLAAQDNAWLSIQLSHIATQVTEKRAHIKMTQIQPLAAPAPPAAVVTDVRVVGMPERVTTASITYDTSGNITATVQHEKDAPAGEAVPA